MVYFQTKNPNLGKFWRALESKMLVYFSHFGMFGPIKIWQPWYGHELLSFKRKLKVAANTIT
jgi:hypothetical protein